uniref:Uncharacterized protein n=1 Tax=Solanum tuberosum TaxID=4113 RepID=M1D852_SOLTU
MREIIADKLNPTLPQVLVVVGNNIGFKLFKLDKIMRVTQMRRGLRFIVGPMGRMLAPSIRAPNSNLRSQTTPDQAGPWSDQQTVNLAIDGYRKLLSSGLLGLFLIILA